MTCILSSLKIYRHGQRHVTATPQKEDAWDAQQIVPIGRAVACRCDGLCRVESEAATNMHVCQLVKSINIQAAYKQELKTTYVY